VRRLRQCQWRRRGAHIVVARDSIVSVSSAEKSALRPHGWLAESQLSELLPSHLCAAIRLPAVLHMRARSSIQLLELRRLRQEVLEYKVVQLVAAEVAAASRLCRE
jgi:hypothetical protein